MLYRIVIEAHGDDPRAIKEDLAMALERAAPARVLEIEPVYEAFLVVDATTGQNGLNQAKVFNEAAKISGVILTKLDGSSKGGIVLSISNTLGIPVKLYGYGEKPEDFDVFNIDNYLYSIFNGVLFEEDTE